MMSRWMAFVGTLAIVITFAAATKPVSGQIQGGTGSAPAAKAWTMPKTAGGQPDLQGMWLNFDSTPFENPAERLASDPAAETRPAPPASAVRQQAGFNFFADKVPVFHRTVSLVVDPPSGRVPVMAWAERKRDEDVAHVNDSWVHQTPWERCITRGVPGAIFSAAYNAAYRIVQGPGYVAIVYEMIHEARIIPTDGSPHLPQNIRFWNGDSRGHWEGNTLVVDITNFNDKGTIATSTNGNNGRIRGIPQSEAAHVVERFTRVGADTINYEVTIDDPKVYTAPWKVAMPLTRNDSYEMYEYACHEGNVTFMETALRGGRLSDKLARDAAEANSK